MIEARSLTMIYGNGHQATDEVSFTVKAGEIVGFAGPNGAGKTTVIKMLTGILKPTSGTAVIVARHKQGSHKCKKIICLYRR